MKPRDPLTFSWAAARVIEIIGAKQAAAVFDRSTSLVYQWADPDNPAQPVMWQGQALDDYCAEHGGETPFADVWAQRARVKAAQGLCPLEIAIKADGDASALVAAVHNALLDGKIDAAERIELNRIIGTIRDSLDKATLEINQPLRSVTAQ